MIVKRYARGPHGQIHLRETGAAGGAPLLCLHATAYSSRSFLPLLRQFDSERHVIAVDTPGYGESDAPEAPLDIAGYAGEIAEMIGAEHQAVDILGYHTGVSIGAEIAIRYPHLVRRLVMIGIPYFRALDFDDWRSRLASRHQLTTKLAQFEERWDFLVTRRAVGLSLQGGFRNFVDELKAWPDGSWAHEALFEHDLDARLPLIGQPVLVLNPAGHLAAPSRIAAQLIQGAVVEEMPDLAGAFLETAADILAVRIGQFLDAEL